MTGALLLRQLESKSAGKQKADQVAHGRALFLGAAHKLGVHLRGDADQPLLQLAHLPEDSTGDMLPATIKRARGVDAPSPLLKGVHPMSSSTKLAPGVGQQPSDTSVPQFLVEVSDPWNATFEEYSIPCSDLEEAAEVFESEAEPDAFPLDSIRYEIETEGGARYEDQELGLVVVVRQVALAGGRS